MPRMPGQPVSQQENDRAQAIKNNACEPGKPIGYTSSDDVKLKILENKLVPKDLASKIEDISSSFNAETSVLYVQEDGVAPKKISINKLADAIPVTPAGKAQIVNVIKTEKVEQAGLPLESASVTDNIVEVNTNVTLVENNVGNIAELPEPTATVVQNISNINNTIMNLTLDGGEV